MRKYFLLIKLENFIRLYIFHDIYSHFSAYAQKFSFFLHDNIIFCKDSNLLFPSSLSKDLSSHGIVNFFHLPTLGKSFTVLVQKNFNTQEKLHSLDAISQNPFALF